MKEEREYLTKTEVIRLLRISKGTLERLMKHHEIVYFKFERRVLFKKADVDRFLESRKVG